MNRTKGRLRAETQGPIASCHTLGMEGSSRYPFTHPFPQPVTYLSSYSVPLGHFLFEKSRDRRGTPYCEAPTGANPKLVCRHILLLRANILGGLHALSFTLINVGKSQRGPETRVVPVNIYFRLFSPQLHEEPKHRQTHDEARQVCYATGVLEFLGALFPLV